MRLRYLAPLLLTQSSAFGFLSDFGLRFSGLMSALPPPFNPCNSFNSFNLAAALPSSFFLRLWPTHDAHSSCSNLRFDRFLSADGAAPGGKFLLDGADQDARHTIQVS